MVALISDLTCSQLTSVSKEMFISPCNNIVIIIIRFVKRQLLVYDWKKSTVAVYCSRKVVICRPRLYSNAEFTYFTCHVHGRPFHALPEAGK